MDEFPETLYVRLEQDRDDAFPVAQDTMDFADEGPVAVYKLVSVGEVRVERTFVPRETA